jgi:hypothetical protein
MYLIIAVILVVVLLWYIYTKETSNVEFIGVTKKELSAVFGKEEEKEEEYVSYSGKKKSKGEKECCRVLEEVFGKPFFTARPNFLKNPETGKNLELDCFNPELKLAVEYNGIQHYKFPNFTGMSEEEFKGQLRRDLFKKKRCKEKGVTLIIVPYTIRLTEIEYYLIEKLQKIGLLRQ